LLLFYYKFFFEKEYCVLETISKKGGLNKKIMEEKEKTKRKNGRKIN
jgi:hypothetical protein